MNRDNEEQRRERGERAEPGCLWLVEPEAVTAQLNRFAREQEAAREVAVCALCVGFVALAAACGPALWAGAARLLRLGVQP